MKIGCIIQARTSSTRLPEKVLKELPFNSGTNVLQQVIRRVKKSSQVNTIVIATTAEAEDQKIVDVATNEGVKWFRGSKENVLERYFLAAKENNLDIVVRITSDCPCIDHEIIDLAIDKHLKEKADYTTNSLKRTFPHGMDTEVFNYSVLEKAFSEAESGFEKEHVTPFFYKSNPGLFKICHIEAVSDLFGPDIRITLDTQADYVLLCAVYDYLYHLDSFFSAKDIVKLFNSKPWMKMINGEVLQKRKYESEEEEVKAAVRILELQELNRAKMLLSRFYEGK